MKSKMFLGGFSGLIVFIALILALDYGSFIWDNIMKPKRENLRRDVFEETKSYNQAKIQQIAKYKFEYNKAENDDTKIVIKAVVRNTFTDYDIDNLPNNLKFFVRESRGY